MKFDKNDNGDTIVVKLNTKTVSHWTKYSELMDVLLRYLVLTDTINLLTHECYDGGHEFSAFQPFISYSLPKWLEPIIL